MGFRGLEFIGSPGACWGFRLEFREPGNDA